MKPDETRWPLLASSDLIWFGGLDFQKDFIIQVDGSEPFWGLGWPGTLLKGSGATRQARWAHDKVFCDEGLGYIIIIVIHWGSEIHRI